MRVIAALGVFCVHTYGLVEIGEYQTIAKYGADGLSLFYILSGLLIMKSYAESPSLKEYWRRRLSRTLPSYYFWLVIIIILRFDTMMLDPFAIPRAILMLEYLTPPIVSVRFSSMWLIGVLTIFMMFYVAVPFISKRVKSLEAAFICFWATFPLCKVINELFHIAYSGIGSITDLDAMVNYLLASVPYFAIGVMIYFGLKENRKWQLMVYCILIIVATNAYDFLGDYKRVAYIAIIVFGLLCVPLKLEKYSKALKFLNRYTMGLFLTHALCIEIASEIAHIFVFSNSVQFALTVTSSCLCAVLLYHFVEVPGAKFINRIMREKPKA